MSTKILYYSFQAALYILWMISFSLIFKPRFRPIPGIGMMLLTFILFALTAVLLQQQSVGRIVSGTLVVLLAMQFLFRGKWYSKLAFTLVILLIMALAEFFAFLFLPEGLNSQTVFSAEFPVLLSIYLWDFFGNFVLMFIATVLAWHFKQRHAGKVTGREWLLILLFPISQYYLLSGWFTTDTAVENFARSGHLAAAILVCIAADVGMTVTMFAVARNTELSTRNKMLKKQLDSQQSYYQELADYYENLRLLRHDIGNHMYTVRILLEEGRTDEAREYAAEIQEKSSFISRLGNCDNPVVDSFLSRRREELEEAGVSLKLSVSLPKRSRIANSDLICALGNLLDNAVEASEETGNKSIWLNMRYDAPYLCVETQNPCPAAPKKKKRRIPELERGQGFAALLRLAEKYDGAFLTEQQDGTFTASLSLRSE